MVATTEVPIDAIQKLVEREMDQLFFETRKLLEANHQESLNMFNGLRHMLEVFASDQADENVEDLIKEANEWLDRTIKPIALTAKEGPRDKQNDRRLDNENESVPAAVQASEVALAARDEDKEEGMEVAREMSEDRE